VSSEVCGVSVVCDCSYTCLRGGFGSQANQIYEGIGVRVVFSIGTVDRFAGSLGIFLAKSDLPVAIVTIVVFCRTGPEPGWAGILGRTGLRSKLLNTTGTGVHEWGSERVSVAGRVGAVVRSWALKAVCDGGRA